MRGRVGRIRILVLASVVAVIVVVLARRRSAPPTPTTGPADWTPLTEHRRSLPPTEAPAWIEPTTDGDCPPGHPIKAKVSSGIYHRPGGLSYERTRPDRCYADAEAAQADGFRAARR